MSPGVSRLFQARHHLISTLSTLQYSTLNGRHSAGICTGAGESRNVIVLVRSCVLFPLYSYHSAEWTRRLPELLLFFTLSYWHISEPLTLSLSLVIKLQINRATHEL